MRRVLPLLLAAAASMGAGAGAAEAPAFTAEKPIALKSAGGNFDHPAVDGRHRRLLIANKANDTLDVVDLGSGKLLRQIPDQKGAASVLYLPDRDLVALGNGGGPGAVHIFAGADLASVKEIPLQGASSVRYNPLTGRLYVVHAPKALAVIDMKTLAVVADIKLSDTAAAFQLEPGRARLYANLPGPGKVVVIDTDKNAIVAEWKLTLAVTNKAMALDEGNRRVFVAARKQPMVIVLDADSGKEIASAPIPADVDDLSYDVRRRRIYASCGDGAIGVVQQIDADHYQALAPFPTGKGARTSVFDAAGDRLYVPMAEQAPGAGPSLLVLAPPAAAPPLALAQTIALRGPVGKLDHMALDRAGQRLFVAFKINNTLDVVDLEAGKLVKEITGQDGISGIAHAPGLKRLFVGNSKGNTVNVLDDRNVEPVATASVPDPDNVTYDARSGRLYVAHGPKGMAVFDVKGAPKLIKDIELPGAPESFRIDGARPRLYVNVPGAREVTVIDTEKNEVAGHYPVKTSQKNYPMALDEAGRRLIIGCRKDPMVVVLDADSGKEVASVPIPADVDDIWFDARHKRIYASTGEGFLAVIQQHGPDRYETLDRLPTLKGARTSLFDPDSGRLFLLLQRQAGMDAPELRVYTVPGGGLAGDAGPYRLETIVPLPHLRAGFSHPSIEPSSKRVFLPAQNPGGEGATLEVIDLGAGRHVKSISEYAASGVCAIPEKRQVVVTSRTEKKARFLDPRTLKVLRAITLDKGPGHVRYDGKRLVVATEGKANIAAWDLARKKWVGEIVLEHPQCQHAVERRTERVFVNMPKANKVAVIDLKKFEIVANWPLKQQKDAHPIDVDEANHRMFTASREGELQVFDTDTGQVVATVPIPRGADDLTYDRRHKRIFVSCKEASVVIQQKDRDHYEVVQTIPTPPGSAISTYSPELDNYVVAVGAQDSRPAELRIYRARP